MCCTYEIYTVSIQSINLCIKLSDQVTCVLEKITDDEEFNFGDYLYLISESPLFEEYKCNAPVHIHATKTLSVVVKLYFHHQQIILQGLNDLCISWNSYYHYRKSSILEIEDILAVHLLKKGWRCLCSSTILKLNSPTRKQQLKDKEIDIPVGTTREEFQEFVDYVNEIQAEMKIFGQNS